VRAVRKGVDAGARVAFTAMTAIAASISQARHVASKRSFKEWWALIKSAASAWSDDYAPSMGAALSYYTVFSMAPLLLIVISVAGLIFGADAARGEIFGQLRGLMGDDAAKAIEGILAGASKPSEGVIGTVIGLVVLIVGATTVFGELQDALDRIWRAPARTATGLWALLRTRLLSFGMILGIAFLLMVSLVLGAVMAALGKWWGGIFGGWEVLAQVVNLAIGFALTTGVFAMIYKLMPRVKVMWHDVWMGALVTAGMFTVGKFLIGLYIGRSGVASGYGAAGSLVIVLVWVYYSAQVFLMGAEFTWVYARTFGSMRGTEKPGAHEPSKPADEIPARSTGPQPASQPKAAPGAAAAPSAVAARAAAAVASPARTGLPAPTLAHAGMSLAALLALRLLVPKLLAKL
jgi:membrane protein